MFSGLRWRLTLLYVLAAVLFVVVLSVSTYHMLATYFQRTTDLGLQHKMAHEFRLLDIPVPPELAAADRDWFANRAILFPDPSPALTTTTTTTTIGDGEQSSAQVVQASSIGQDYAEEFYDGELSAIFVLPLDEHGRLLFDPNPHVPPLPPNTDAVAAALEKGADWRTITLANGTPVRLFTYRLHQEDGPAVLQLGRALIDRQRILNQLVFILLLVGGTSVLVPGAGSWWLAGRAIIPAQQAWARQQAFVANASHELRTPLALIRTSTEAVQRRLPADTPRCQELLADVISESDHTTELINDLLLLSRLDAGRVELASEQIDLSLFLQDLARHAEPLAQEHHITLTTASVSGYVLADAARLHQVLLILLDNALHHTPPGGSITLSAEPAGKQVRIHMADSGRGIPAADLPHIFERFYRSDETRAGEGGSGLGLSIAKAFIESMHGRIEVVSAEGVGTRVTIILSGGV